MKIAKLFLMMLAGLLLFVTARSQNVLMNILSHEQGIVKKGKTFILEITVCNTDPLDSMPVYKLRPQISVPGEIAKIDENGHSLPGGWSVVSNDGSTIRLSNGTDMIPPTGCRTLLISVTGKKAGGPSTISGNMLFSNGKSPGSVLGGSTRNDNLADNTSTTTCKIIK